MSAKRAAADSGVMRFSPRCEWILTSLAVAAFTVLMLAGRPQRALAQAAAPAPTPSPAAFVLSGEDDYVFHCASCHGLKALGDGPAADTLKVKPANLTLLAQRNGGVFPEKRVIATIDGSAAIAAHGTRDMPVWGDIFEQQATYSYNREATAREVHERIQRLVDYLKSIQRK